MLCSSEVLSATKFVAMVRKDPDLVFVKGYWQGSLANLTVSSFMELTPYLAVVGPGSSWRVHLHNETGRQIMAVQVSPPLNYRRAKKIR